MFVIRLSQVVTEIYQQNARGSQRVRNFIVEGDMETVLSA